jgi:hypothetical protein
MNNNEIIKQAVMAAENAGVIIERFETLSISFRGVIVEGSPRPMIIASVKDFESYEFVYGKFVEAKEFINQSKIK